MSFLARARIRNFLSILGSGAIGAIIWGSITGTLSNQADLWKLTTETRVIHQLSDLAEFYNAVDDTYDLPRNRYLFDNDVVVDKQIRLVTTNGFYIITTRSLNLLSYNGTDPFITTNTTGVALKIIDTFISTPTATAVEFDGYNSFLTDLAVFFGCKKGVSLANGEFATVTETPFVSCEDGIEFTDVQNINVSSLQYNAGPDLGGVGYSFNGPGINQVNLDRIDSRPEATEAMFFFNADATNLRASISSGNHAGPGPFFSATSRDQTDVRILVSGISNVQNSAYEIGLYNTAVQTTIFGSPGDTEVIEGTFAVSSDERFEFTEVAGKARITYIGEEPLRGVEIIAKASVVPVSGSVVQYCQHIRFTPVSTGTPVLDPQSQDDAYPSNNNPRKTICATLLDMEKGDFFEYVSTSVGHSTNAEFSTISVIVKG